MARVVFDDVTKRFDGTVAVDRLDLDIADGEFLVLLGPSGCGKSTALRMIAGLDEPTEGTIRIDDRVVNYVDPKDRDLAMVFQSYALYPNMTVRRNVAFPLKPRGVSKADADRVVREAAAMLGLSDLLDRKPGQLSGGQRQRVALARAIVRQPRVFLMDEPLSNLDAKMRMQTRGDLVELHRRLGTTFVYVTHDQAEAMTMADRVAVLNAGRLQQVGPPQAVYDRPANLFVARFLGSPPMNVLPGTVDGTSVTVGGATFDLPRRVAVGARRVDVGIRPEHLALASGTVGGADMAGTLGGADMAGTVGGADMAGTVGGADMAGTVELVESLGYERLVRCAVDGGTVIVRAAPGAADPAIGERVSVRVDARRVHLFDPVTTERLD
jgi:multiple sugar transport system ATP-binding protein